MNDEREDATETADQAEREAAEIADQAPVPDELVIEDEGLARNAFGVSDDVGVVAGEPMPTEPTDMPEEEVLKHVKDDERESDTQA